MKSETIEWAKTRGFRPEVTNGGHVRLLHRAFDEPIIVASTPGSTRAVVNEISLIKRIARQHGVDLDGSRKRSRHMQFDIRRNDTPPLFETTVQCCQCDKQFHWRSRRDATMTPQPSAIAKQLRRHGWHIERDRFKDLCPSCVLLSRGIEEAAKQPTPVNVEETAVSLATANDIEAIIALPAAARAILDSYKANGLYGRDDDEIIHNIVVEKLRQLLPVVHTPDT